MIQEEVGLYACLICSNPTPGEELRKYMTGYCERCELEYRRRHAEGVNTYGLEEPMGSMERLTLLDVLEGLIIEQMKKEFSNEQG